MKNWIDRVSTVDAKSLNDLELSIDNLDKTKMSFPAGGTNGAVLIKDNNSVTWSTNIVDASIIDGKYYTIEMINKFLNGSSSSVGYNTLDTQFNTNSKYLIPAINENYNNLLNHINSSNVHGIQNIKTQLQNNIDDLQVNINTIDNQLSSINDDIQDINDQIADLYTKVNTPVAGGSSIGLEDYKTKIFSLMQTGIEHNKSGEHSVVFGDGNDLSNATYSIASGYRVIGNHGYLSIFGQELKSDSNNELLIGKFNAPVTNGKFVIGNGSSDALRSNLLQLDASGNLKILDVFNLNSGKLSIKESLTTKEITADKITINTELLLNNLKLVNLTSDNLTVNGGIVGNSLDIANNITAKNLTLSEKLISKNIENSQKVITDSLETKSVLVADGTNTLQLAPDFINVNNLIVNKDSKLNGNVTVIIDTNTATNKFSVIGPSEFNSVKTGDLTTNSIVCANSASISGNLKIYGRILDSDGNSGDVGQVLTSNGVNNFKWAEPQFNMPDVALNLKDYGILYGLIQKSDASKPNKAGYYSVVFGQYNDREKANYSITSGYDNNSSDVHNFTQLFGEGLRSDNSSETIIGSYNKSVTNGSFIIGNGVDSLNRSNLFEFDKFGNLNINNADNTSIFKLDKNSNLTINNKFTANSIDVENLRVGNGIDLDGVSLSFDNLNVENLTVNDKTILKGIVELRNNLTSLASIEANALKIDSKITSDSLEVISINNTGTMKTTGIINTGNEEITGTLAVTGDLTTLSNIKSSGDLTINDINSKILNADKIITGSIKTDALFDSTGRLDDKIGYILTVNADGKTVSWKANTAFDSILENLLDYGTNYGLVQKSINGNTSGTSSVVFGDSNNRVTADYSITSGTGNSSLTGHNYTNIFGQGLISDNLHETLIGKYNKQLVDGAFVIGNGTGNITRGNLFELDKNGAINVNNGNTSIFKLDKDSNLVINNKFTAKSIDIKDLKVSNSADLQGISLSIEDLNAKNLTIENKSILKGIVELSDKLTSTSDISANALKIDSKITSDSLEVISINNTGTMKTTGIINTGNEEITGTLSVGGDLTALNNIKATGNLTINNITSNDINANKVITKSLKTDALLDSTGRIDDKIGYILTVNADGQTISWKANTAFDSILENLLDYGTNYGLVQKSANGNAVGTSSVAFGDSNSRITADYSITSGTGNSSLAGHHYTNIFGQGLISDNLHETLIGKYNKQVVNGAFIIGNGTNTARANLFELDKNGAINVNNGSTSIFKLDQDSNLTINNKLTAKSLEIQDLKVNNNADLQGLSLTLEDLDVQNLTVQLKTILKGEVEISNKLTSTSNIEANAITVDSKITSASLDTALINNTGMLNTVGIKNTGNEEISGALLVGGEISTTNNIKSTGNLTVANIKGNDLTAKNIIADSLKTEVILDSTGVLDDKIGYVLTVNSDGQTVSWKPNLSTGTGMTNLIDYGTNYGVIQKSTNGNTAGANSVVFGESNSRSSATYSITSGKSNSSSAGHDFTNMFGQGLLSDGPYETLIGKYNRPTTNGAFVIGNGTSAAKSNLLSLDFSGNLNINNKLTLNDGDLTTTNSINSKSATFDDLIINNSLAFVGADLSFDNLTIKGLTVTDSFEVSATNSNFVNEVTIGQTLNVQNIVTSSTIQASTIKTTGSISADGNINSKNNIIAAANISGSTGMFTNSLSTNGDFEASAIKGSSLTITGNASADVITCTSIAVKSIIDSDNKSGGSGNVLSISDDGSRIVWKSINSDSSSGLQNLLDYGPDSNYSLVQKTADSSTNNTAGINSVVFGISNTREKSAYSITSGKENYTAAQHDFTEVFGEQLVTDNSYEMLLGKYNNAVTNGAFVIGIGNNDSTRRNLLELNKQGQLKINNGATNLLTLDSSGNLSIKNRVSGGIATFDTLTVTNGIEFGGDAVSFRDLELDSLIVNTSAEFKCGSVAVDNDIAVTGTLTSATGDFTNLTGNILNGVTCNLTTINSDNIVNTALMQTNALKVTEDSTIGGKLDLAGALNGNIINGTSGTFTDQLNIAVAKIDQVKDHNDSVGGENYFLSSDGQYTKWVQIDLGSLGGGGGSGTDYSSDISALYSYIGSMQDLKSENCLDLVSAINEVYDKAFSPTTSGEGGGVGQYYPDNDNPTASSGIIFNDYGNNMADGKYSASFGYQTKAMSDYQFVCGKQNIFDSSALFVVGNGSGDTYQNAFAITETGDAKIAGIIKSKTGTCANGDILTAATGADGNLELKWNTVNAVTGIDTINSRLDTIEGNTANIGTIRTDVSTLKTNYTALEGRMTTAESNITDLQTNIGTIQTDLTTAQSDIGTLQTDLTTAQSDIGTLQTNVGNAEGNITDAQADISQAQIDIADLQTKIGDLTTSPTTNKTDMMEIIGELYAMVIDLQNRVITLEGGTPPTP